MLAGAADTFGSTDATGTAARFNSPIGIAVDGSGTLYIADTNSSRSAKSPPAMSFPRCRWIKLRRPPGAKDGTGSAAHFFRVTGLALDSSGTLFVTDYSNQLIRKVTAAGVVTTIAGTSGAPGALDGTGYLIDPSLFFNPSGTATDAAGNVYVADTGNSTIRQITPSSGVTTLAGDANIIGAADGTGSAASFRNPNSVTVDHLGNIYVADTGNHLIRKIAPGRIVTTLAGSVGVPCSADGTGTAASFDLPSGVAADSVGNVFVSDYNNDTIRKIAPGGVVTTFAGSADVEGSADGNGGLGWFQPPAQPWR